MIIKGYSFYTEASAKEARKSAADYKGIPKNPKDITQFWVNYNYSKPDNIYYITYVDGLEDVFGDPIDITLTDNNSI